MEQASLVIDFVKMNGCGNDFVVIDARKPELEGLELTAQQVQTIATRSNTITKGCDQVLVIRPPKAGGTVFMEIRNADGVQVEACGNGTRAVASYLADNDNMKKGSIETLGGILKYDNGTQFFSDIVTITIPPPKLRWEEIPLRLKINESAQKLRASFQIEHLPKIEHIFFVNLGNPHAVFFITGETEAFAEKYGKKLEQHSLFPARANINFARIKSEDEIRKWIPDKYETPFPVNNVIELSTWERGVGLTKSCGTGACATAIARHRLFSQESEASYTIIKTRGGMLQVSYSTGERFSSIGVPPLTLGGRAEFEFPGKVAI